MKVILELARRISAEGKIDFSEPQFFSISIDHATVYINVHWLSKDAESGAYCFHMRHLQRYFLDVDGLKAVDLAVKNILHYCANKRLLRIRQQLDMYAQKVDDMAPLDKAHLTSNSTSEEHQLKRKKHSRRNRSQKRQRKKNRAKSADCGGEEDEEDEEDSEEEGEEENDGDEDEDEDELALAFEVKPAPPPETARLSRKFVGRRISHKGQLRT